MTCGVIPAAATVSITVPPIKVTTSPFVMNCAVVPTPLPSIVHVDIVPVLAAAQTGNPVPGSTVNTVLAAPIANGTNCSVLVVLS